MADEYAVDSFLDLLRQSDLVPDDQVLALMADSSGAGKGSQSAHKLADELVKRELLTAWQADMLLQGKHRGFHLGPYRILRPLGQGGMSKVFLGEHKVMRRCCAIKVLPAKYEEDPDLLNRFQLEARAIAALDHPNIVRAYDFNKDVRHGKDMHYLVMEYVDGPDLRRMVDEQGPLDYRKAADFICQAAEGLAHAHALGFVHRDIKPANLLVDPHGVLKVLDLGLARFNFDADQEINATEGSQSAVGTADYIAPEQVADSRHVDGRADIYSLGHTFYFLLTGHRPFTKPSIMELLMAHRTEEPEPIGKTRPDVPMELEAIIARMTAKSPIQRYQTAKEVADKLRTWLNESGSGRGYSRISALMAEAMRAKQLAGQDTTRMQSAATEDTDLELASLDDEPTRSRSAREGKAGKTTSPDAKNKDRQSVAKNGLAPAAKTGDSSAGKRQAAESKSASSGAHPIVAGEETVLPSIGADLLSVPLATEAVPAAALPAAAVAGKSLLQGMTALRPKAAQTSASTVISPWLWGSLAALGLIVLVSSSFILFGRSSTETAGEQLTAKDMPPAPAPATNQVTEGPGPKPGLTTAATSKADEGRPAKPPKASNGPPSKSGQPAIKAMSGAALTSSQPTAPAPEIENGKMAESEKTPSSTEEMGDQTDTTQPTTPTEDKSKAEAPKSRSHRRGDGRQAQTAQQQPTKEKEEVVDKAALLRGMTTIALNPKASIDNNPGGTLNMYVLRQASEAVKKLELTPILGKDPPVLEIELKTNTSGDSTSLEISAELKCATEKQKAVTVWQDKKTILTGKTGKIRLTQNPGLMTNLRPPIKEFFEQFVADVRRAQEKGGAN